MKYICPKCGQLAFDFEEFRLGSPKCDICKVPMMPDLNGEDEAKCIIPMPEDDTYVVCD